VSSDNLISGKHDVGPLAACDDASALVKPHDHVPGSAALHLEPAAHLPPFYQNVPLEREGINSAESENVRPVKEAASAIKGTVQRIGPGDTSLEAVRSGGVVHALRPGVGKLALQAVGEAPVQPHL